CRGKQWVRPITELDVYRHVHATVLTGSGDYLVDGEVNAVLPGGSTTMAAPDTGQKIAEKLAATRGQGMGSNALAVGAQGVAGGQSLLLGNPHFPWQGRLRLWQVQLTIPGKLNVSGGSLLGLPAVNIGHNDNVAWSHTVATAVPFGLFDTPLVPFQPTKYIVDGHVEDMTPQQVSVEVL